MPEVTFSGGPLSGEVRNLPGRGGLPPVLHVSVHGATDTPEPIPGLQPPRAIVVYRLRHRPDGSEYYRACT